MNFKIQLSSSYIEQNHIDFVLTAITSYFSFFLPNEIHEPHRAAAAAASFTSTVPTPAPVSERGGTGWTAHDTAHHVA